MSNLMHNTISLAIVGTVPQTKKRSAALASVRWVLATEDGQFVSISEKSRKTTLTRDLASASIYDGRDNEELKQRFMETLLGVLLTVVLIDE